VYQSGPRRLHTAAVNGAKSNNSRCGNVNIEEPRRDECAFMDAVRSARANHATFYPFIPFSNNFAKL
jgi:hypothetical protein